MPQAAVSAPSISPEMSQAESQLAGINTELDTRLKPLEEQRSSAMTSLQRDIATPPPAAPKLETIPTYQPRTIQPQEARSFMAISTAMSALVSLMTRQPFTNALNAAGAAMEGYHKGFLDQANLDLKNFKVQADAAVQRNNQALQEYNAVLRNRQLAMSQKMSMLNVIAAKEKDEIAVAQLRSGNLRSFLSLLQKREDGMRQWEQFAAKFHQSAQQHADNMKMKQEAIDAKNKQLAGSTLTASQVEPSAWRFLLTGKMPSLGFGAAQNRVQIISAAAQIGKAMGLTPQDQALLPYNTEAQGKALDFMTKWGSGVKKGEEAVRLNAQVMMEYAQKLGFTDIQLVNKAILGGETQFGDPDAQAYANAAITVMNEYARVMSGPLSNAMLHQGAQERAAEMLRKEGSIAQLKSSITVMERDMANQDRGVEDTIQGIHAAMKVNEMRKQAPPEAVQYLHLHPDTAPQFREKYGYLPSAY